MSRRHSKRFQTANAKILPPKSKKPMRRSAAVKNNDSLTFDALERRNLLAAGILDTSFSEDGRLAINVNQTDWSTTYESAMAVQGDGKLVVAAEFAQGNISGALVMRINSDGSLDETFSPADGDAYWDGGSGRAWFGSTAHAISNPHDIVVQLDGKILVLGDGGLIRLNSDGRLDSTFGAGGVVDTFTGTGGLLPNTTNSHFYSIALQDSGHIILGGHTGTTSANSDFYIVRLTPIGLLDTSFGTAGRAQVNIGGGTSTTDIAYDIAVEDGKIVAVGNTKLTSSGSLLSSAVIRLQSTGALDLSFSGDGIWNVDVNPGSLRQETLFSVTLPGDGSVIMSGHATLGSSSGSNFLLIKLDQFGGFDSSFTSNGYELYSLGMTSSISHSVITDNNDNIIASGWGNEGGATDRYVVARFTPNGALDTSFGGDGAYSFWPGIDAGGTNSTSVRDVVIRPSDQSIAVCGQTYVYSAFDGTTVNPYTTFDVTVAVFDEIDGTPETSFDDDGVVSYAGNIYSYDEGFSVVGQADGKLLISGLTSQIPGALSDFVVARVNSDGSLDNTFDTDGIKTIWFGSYSSSSEDKANALAVQEDGKIIVAGVVDFNTTNRKFGVARLNPDGSLDETFAGTGQIILNPSTGHDELFAVAIQPDGKILIGGYTTTIVNSLSSVDFAVMRLNSDGTTDNSFGASGIWSQHMGTASNSHKIRSLLVQPDGKIVVSSGFGPTTGGGAVARLNSNGTLDTSFDADGMRTFTTLPGSGSSTITIDHLEASTLQSDGKIILVGNGRSNTGTTGDDFVAIRLNSDGSLDTSFDADGYRLIPAAPGAVVDEAYGVAVQQNGRIVITGQSSLTTNNPDFSIVRLNSDGSIDTTFANSGGGTFDLSGTAVGYPDVNSDDYSRSMYLEPGGNIVVGGFGIKIPGINHLPADMEMIRVIGDRLPIDIVLSNSTINENSPPNSLVGLLSTIDPDSEDTHMYSLVSGSGDSNNSEFAIVGNQLVALAPFDFETTPPRTIRIRTTDQTGSYFEESFIITVLDANEAPVAIGESFTTLEDTPLGQSSPGVLANDTDPESQTLSAELVLGATNGIVVLNTDGSWTYTPNANWNGNDSFTYRAVDTFGLPSEEVTVSIEVVPVDDAPTTSSQSLITNEDTDLVIWLNGDDGDPELNQALTFSLGTGPGNGSISYFNPATGEVHYSPNSNFNGSDSFTFSATDGSGAYANAAISIDVLPVNDGPVAVDDYYAATEDTSLVVSPAGVLGNDSDVDGNTLAVTLGTSPTNGSLNLNADGSFTYIPAANFNGSDSFTYMVSDGALTAQATVHIDVAAVDDAPTTSSQSLNTNEDTDLVIWLNGDDGDPELNQALTFSLGSGPSNGTISYFNPATGEVHYSPNSNFNGSDSFTFSATDGSGACANAAISIDVLPANDEPTADAGPDQAVIAGTSVSLLGQFADVDVGDTHLFSWHVTSSNGQMIADGDSTAFDFVPNAAGTYTAVFTVQDSAGATAWDEMVVIVSPNVTVQPVQVSGRVYDDANNDGIYQPGSGEIGLGGVVVTLTGTDLNGSPVNLSTMTNADGVYSFSDVLPGTYSITVSHPAGWLDGRESAGSRGGNVDNAADSNVISGIVIANDGVATIDYLFGSLMPAEISGLVWEDFNADAEVNFGERAIANAQVNLSGVDDRGNTVQLNGQTDADGVFMFFNLRPGSYVLSEDQPVGFEDGAESLGMINGSPSGMIVANDTIGSLNLAAGSVAINYNFAERAAENGDVSSGQTATIGFWQNKNGRALVLSLNGGANSKQLSSWLAATFPNMYGANAGANNLTGKTNLQVWEHYNMIFRRKQQEAAALGLGGPVKMDAQVFATALAVYVTNQTLAGNAASSYGFVVTQSGVGASTFNVGSAGQAFGVANNTQVSVLDLLLAVDSYSQNGVLFDNNGDGDANDSSETLMRTLANNVFSDINEQGDI